MCIGRGRRRPLPRKTVGALWLGSAMLAQALGSRVRRKCREWQSGFWWLWIPQAAGLYAGLWACPVAGLRLVEVTQNRPVDGANIPLRQVLCPYDWAALGWTPVENFGERRARRRRGVCGLGHVIELAKRDLSRRRGREITTREDRERAAYTDPQLWCAGWFLFSSLRALVNPSRKPATTVSNCSASAHQFQEVA